MFWELLTKMAPIVQNHQKDSRAIFAKLPNSQQSFARYNVSPSHKVLSFSIAEGADIDMSCIQLRMD